MFANCNNGYSLSDLAVATGNNRNNEDGFGNGYSWIWIILIFAIFGWGGNGFGNWGGNNGTTALNADLQRGFDTQSIISKLDGINNGLCSLGYDQLAQMNGINNNINQTGNAIVAAINADTVAGMQNTNALSRQFSDCCCENRAAIKDVQYNMATLNCATNNIVHQTGDAIINNQNNGFNMLNQTIKDGFCELKIAQKDQQIAELTAKLNACDRDTALQGTASYIINSVRPTPGPAWVVQNPWSSCGCNQFYSNGCGNGCGCNNYCG